MLWTGGASLQPELRAPAMRGCLRVWLRALIGGVLGENLATLRAIETAIYVLIGFLLVPVMAIASLVPFVHMCYAAYKVYQGVDYRYPVIADMVDSGRRFA